MMPASFHPFPCLVLVAVLASPSAAQPPATAPPPSSESILEIARLGLVEGTVEFQRGSGPWQPASEAMALAIGDRIRTPKAGSARLDFPWTAIAVGDASEIAIERARVLTLRLHQGRIDIDPEQTLLRVVTDEAALSGTGRTLVRREGNSTFVGSYNGGAEVEAKGQLVRLGVNGGTLVKGGTPPTAPVAMKPSPRVVAPASDPRYVRPGEVVRLVWSGDAPLYQLEVLAIDSDVPFLSLEVGTTAYDLKLPWLGTFRWRVAGRSGVVETQPSSEGLICVVEK